MGQGERQEGNSTPTYIKKQILGFLELDMQAIYPKLPNVVCTLSMSVNIPYIPFRCSLILKTNVKKIDKITDL